MTFGFFWLVLVLQQAVQQVVQAALKFVILLTQPFRGMGSQVCVPTTVLNIFFTYEKSSLNRQLFLLTPSVPILQQVPNTITQH